MGLGKHIDIYYVVMTTVRLDDDIKSYSVCPIPVSRVVTLESLAVFGTNACSIQIPRLYQKMSVD